MRIDPFRLASLISAIQAALRQRPGKLPAGDIGLYIACREVIQRQEEKYSLIWFMAGYSVPAVDPQRVNNAALD